MRDSLIQIKRYLYRRICERNFPPLSAEAVSKADLRRYSTWLQPIMLDAPTKTEVYCLNSRPGHKSTPRVGTPVVLFPLAKRANKEFFNDNFSCLKERVLRERRIPVGLLALLSGKSSKEHRDSVGCLIEVLRPNKDPYSLLRPPLGGVVRMAQWLSSDNKLASFSTLGNGSRNLTAVTTANRYQCLDIDIDP